MIAIHLTWERMREGHTTRGAWYPDPPPAMCGEKDDHNAYTNRLIGADKTGRSPYDHYRYRECRLGYHLTCSTHRIHPRGDGGCECPCHTEPGFGVDFTDATGGIIDAAKELADLYYLPLVTGQRVMFAAAVAINSGSVTDHDSLRVVLSGLYRSPIGPWFATDVATVLAEHEPDLKVGGDD